MHDRLISVIVPVYNVEKYLCKCIDSIITQTYTNLEIILVDDGSSDNCGKICDEYAGKDSRIKVIHQNNRGLSVARNVGVDISTGDYISFIDSDDYVDNNYFEVMINLTGEGSMVACTIAFEEEENARNAYKTYKNQYYSSLEALREMCHEKNLGTSACGKLINRETANKYRFPAGKFYEDLFTVYKWYANSKSVVSTSATAYHYIHRFGSISNNEWNDKTVDLMEAAEDLLVFIKNERSAIYIDGVYRYFFSAHDFIKKAYRSENYKKFFSQYQKRLRPLWKYVVKNDLSLREMIIYSMLAFCPHLYFKLYKIKQRQ